MKGKHGNYMLDSEVKSRPQIYCSLCNGTGYVSYSSLCRLFEDLEEHRSFLDSRRVKLSFKEWMGIARAWHKIGERCDRCDGEGTI